MTTQAAARLDRCRDVLDPVDGGPLYTIYTDPNGLTVNVPTNPVSPCTRT